MDLDKLKFFAQYIEIAQVEMNFINSSKSYISLLSPKQLEAIKYSYQKERGDSHTLESSRLILRDIYDLSQEECVAIAKDILQLSLTEKMDIIAVLLMMKMPIPVGNDVLLKQFKVQEYIMLNDRLRYLGVLTSWNGMTEKEIIDKDWVIIKK